jgi:SM-20-related protein
MSFVILADLVDSRTADALLRYAIENEARFAPTTISRHGVRDERFRRSVSLDDLSSFRPVIEAAVGPRLPGLVQRLKMGAFEPTGYELELVGHGEGAFYKRHIDVFTGAQPDEEHVDDRMLSVVLYLHSTPSGFTGGALRLYPDLKPPHEGETSVDVPAIHGTAVAFSSWVPHEVRPITCPSGRFSDFRFALNCWVLRRRATRLSS